MCAQRYLSSGLTADVVKSRLTRRDDARQCAFDLDAPTEASSETSAEQTIYRLSYEVAELRSKLARAGLGSDSERITYQAYSSERGWAKIVDAVARLARAFASRLEEVKCIRTLRTSGEPDDEDARCVNAHIAMIAEEAESASPAKRHRAGPGGLLLSGGVRPHLIGGLTLGRALGAVHKCVEAGSAVGRIASFGHSGSNGISLGHRDGIALDRGCE